jgi:beta-1,4-mannosyl-glycoprotein beta-1,4-N-acetylglucosaminyltransferase
VISKKIYDCFIFYNELELLRIRFDELYDLVDHFVVCEATVTFQGKAKALTFDQHKKEFRQYADKIIHVVVDDMAVNHAVTDGASRPKEAAFWSREHHQRNSIRRGLESAAPEDIVCISDCDEILSRDTIRFLRGNAGYFLLDMPMYQFFLNMCAQNAGWRKAFAYSYALDRAVGDFNFIRTHEDESHERFAGQNHRVTNAGWHFTFLGGAKQVREKLEAYSHAGCWQREMQNDEVLSEQMLALREVGGSKVLRFHPIDESFPSRVQREREQYCASGLAKDNLTRLKELETLWSASDNRHRACSQLYRQTLRLLEESRRALGTQGIRVPASVNWIPSSQKFGLGWNRGVQSQRACLSDAVPAAVPGSLPMQHARDASAITPDSNVGYFNLVPVVPGRTYTASCLVWLPEHFLGQIVELSLDDWPVQRKSGAAIEVTGRWQRIESHGIAPSNVMGCNVVLRITAREACTLYSSCWQFEEGDTATDYLATDA